MGKSITIREATFQDYPGLDTLWRRAGIFTARYSPDKSEEDPFHDTWRRLWDGNPAIKKADRPWPIGWILESHGSPVGAVLNIPDRYSLGGRTFTAAVATGLLVDPEFRPYSLRLLRVYLAQPDVDLFPTTTASSKTKRILQAYGKPTFVAPAGAHYRHYLVLDYRRHPARPLRKLKIPFVKRPCHLALAAFFRVRDAASRRGRFGLEAASGYEVIPADNIDQRFDTFWNRLTETYPDRLLVFRDAETLRWRLGSDPASGDARIHRLMRGGDMRGYAITHFDPKTGLVSLTDLQVLDETTSAVASLLAPIAETCRQRGIPSIEIVGMSPHKQELFARLGLYRTRRPFSHFYYGSRNPDLQESFAATATWDPCLIEGDLPLRYL